jgi:outer membrane protein assembly factor BamB
MLISERGELIWKRRLPTDTRLAGDRPLVLSDHRVWVGLVKESEPRVRYLYEVSASDGTPESETSIDDLAMFCPTHASGGVLVLDTQHGLAGFDIENGLKRRWSIEAPVAMGTCILQDGHLLVATQNGELLRVAFTDGRKETLMRLPRKQVWVPPAPDLSPGVHGESAGAIEHLVSLPGGVAFSVSWSSDRAVIQFHPW